MSKMKIYHFHNGMGGGVLSVIKNLLKFSSNSNVENHVIYAVNQEQLPNYKVEPLDGAASQQLFFYNSADNFYHTCGKLAKLLPDEAAIILAHDWIELAMASNLGLQNRVLYVLHGDFDYYYELAEINNSVIDAFICISPTISRVLKTKLPHRQNDIHYLNFPVVNLGTRNNTDETIKLIYYVRDLCDVRKQFDIIIKIASQLADVSELVYFTIAGGGMQKEDFFKVWPTSMRERVNYLGMKSNEDIIEILPNQDIFLLPSLSEGLPVSLVEAMKAGIVPIITNWNGSVEELVCHAETGYYVEIGEIKTYVAIIKDLIGNPQLLKMLSVNCQKRANQLFNPRWNTKKFEDLYFTTSNKMSATKLSRKKYGSRLDQPWVPNFLVKLVRKIIK
jgi:glycosyltransferase involved in cell wall biosynthesis